MTPNQVILASIDAMARMRAIEYQTRTFKADVDEWLVTAGLSARSSEHIRMQFDAILRNVSHAERYAIDGDDGNRVHYLVTSAHLTGKLAEIFLRHRREGWVSRAQALARVIRNAIVNQDLPV